MRAQTTNRTLKTTVLLAVVGWLALTVVGCGNLDESNETNGTESWTCETCDDIDDETEVDVEGESEVEGEEIERPSTLDPCTPQPTAAAHTEKIPTIPDRVRRNQCPLREEQTERIGTDGSSYDESIEWRRTETGFRKIERGRDGDIDIDLRFELDGGKPTRIERDAPANSPYERAGEAFWELDDQGRLLTFREIHWSDAEKTERVLLHEIEQTWSDGRLASRDVRWTNAGDEEPTVSKTRWTYDDEDRLVEARRTTDDGSSRRVEWTYSTKGRPISAKRYVDGERVSHQQWSYHDDGRLASRSVRNSMHQNDSLVGVNRRGHRTELDDLAATRPTRPMNAYGVFQLDDIDDRALPREDSARGCYHLPNSVGHGYPNRRQAYRFLWKFDETAEAATPGSTSREIAPMYNARAGVWEPAEGWYGHGGALGPPPTATTRYADAIDQLEVDIDYDSAGRMISQTVRRTDSEGGTIRFERSRTFGENGLTADRLFVTNPEAENDDDGPVDHRRTLRFERGPEGRLERRELLVDGERIDYQEFAYDSAGRWVELETFSRRESQSQYGVYPRFSDLTRPVESQVSSAEFQEGASFRRAFDADGRRTLLAWSADNHNYGNYRQRISWGPHGPLEITVDDPERDNGSDERRQISYDDRGRKNRTEVVRGDTTVAIERWKWRGDELTVHTRESPPSGRLETTRYRYACDATR